MVIVWILLWTLAFIIIIKANRTESTVWMSAIFFLTGLGAFSVVLQERIMKFCITIVSISHETINVMYSINAILVAIVNNMVPYFILLYGLSNTNIIHKDKKKIIYCILFIPSILNFIFLPIKSNYSKTPEELVTYFRELATWTVPYMLAGIFFLVYSFFKEKSFVMKKYRLFNIIIMIPCISYIILGNVIFRAIGLDNSWEYWIILIPIGFTGVLYIAFKYGIFGISLKFDRYKFAFENIIEFASDSIIILDKDLNIIEYNEKFINNFLIDNKKYKNFNEMISSSKIYEYKDSLLNSISESENNNIKAIEILINNNGEIKYFSEIKYFEVHVNPVILNCEFLGTVLVFKDITVYKKNIELIKQNQIELIEKERLLSLNQLIGGIAHNLKTPLMSSAGGIQVIKRNTGKIYKYIQKNCSDATDITISLDEINDWQQNITEYLIYMSNIIDVVKGQVTEYSKTSEVYFSIKELDEKITLLMAFEIKKSKCVYVKEININPMQKINGDVNSLLQVLNNLITNAIESSENHNIVTFGVDKIDSNIIFFVRNTGPKIPEEIQERIFTRMVTTKGKNGNGLGLYISKLIIKVRFNAEIYFDTNDKETTFFVKIPIIGEE
ncbi:ATP-binding protein [Clostridium akagii]|uniref:ATP-binding protein n=1 Tax=Clostridium akagii TaxID=91623 RepID=UPI00047E200B|nr:ATP-binding protein [Clostridium akagii]